MANEHIAVKEQAARLQTQPLRWISHGANIAVIASVVLMFVIYQLQRSDAEDFSRRNTTVNLMSLRYQDRILSAEKDINDYIIRNGELYRKVSMATLKDPAPDVVLDNETRASFVLLIDFYTDILSCVESEQCEKRLVDQWFKNDICQFSKNAEIVGFTQIAKVYGDQLAKTLKIYVSTECI